jgi:hypothetical protein
MPARACTICKHLGKSSHSHENLDMGYLYNGQNTVFPVKVHLCRSHSVELFKRGQKRFLLNYRSIINDVVNSDEVEFLRILDKTVRLNEGRLINKASSM